MSAGAQIEVTDLVDVGNGTASFDEVSDKVNLEEMSKESKSKSEEGGMFHKREQLAEFKCHHQINRILCSTLPTWLSYQIGLNCDCQVNLAILIIVIQGGVIPQLTPPPTSKACVAPVVQYYWHIKLPSFKLPQYNDKPTEGTDLFLFTSRFNYWSLHFATTYLTQVHVQVSLVIV